MCPQRNITSGAFMLDMFLQNLASNFLQQKKALFFALESTY